MSRDSLLGTLVAAVKAVLSVAPAQAPTTPPAQSVKTVFIVFHRKDSSAYGEPVVAFTDFERAQARRDAMTNNGLRSEVIGISLET